LGRKESKGGGEEETRTETLLVRPALILPRLPPTFSGSLSTILSTHSSTVLNTGWRELVKASDVISVNEEKSPHSHRANLEESMSVLVGTLWTASS